MHYKYSFQKQDCRILMSWRLKGYPEKHYADIEILLKDQKDSTKIEINASRVPSNMAEETQQGLDRCVLFWSFKHSIFSVIISKASHELSDSAQGSKHIISSMFILIFQTSLILSF